MSQMFHEILAGAIHGAAGPRAPFWDGRMANGQGYAITYSGHKIGPGIGSPSIEDIAVQQGRMCRYAGALRVYYPVLLHSLVVSDMVIENFKAYAMLHDGPELCTNDVPRGFKPPSMKIQEQTLFNQFCLAHNLAFITREEYDLYIKPADDLAAYAEILAFGNSRLREEAERAGQPKDAEIYAAMTLSYFKKYPPEECIRPDNLAAVEFIRRFHSYKSALGKAPIRGRTSLGHMANGAVPPAPDFSVIF